MADVEAIVTAFLREMLELGNTTDPFVCTELPADLQTRPWVIQVLGLTGTRNFTVVSPAVSVNSFATASDPAAARIAAREHALVVENLIAWRLRGRTYAGCTISRVATPSTVAERPYSNTNLRRFGSTHRIWTTDPAA